MIVNQTFEILIFFILSNFGIEIRIIKENSVSILKKNRKNCSETRRLFFLKSILGCFEMCFFELSEYLRSTLKQILDKNESASERFSSQKWPYIIRNQHVVDFYFYLKCLVIFSFSFVSMRLRGAVYYDKFKIYSK